MSYKINNEDRIDETDGKSSDRKWSDKTRGNKGSYFNSGSDAVKTSEKPYRQSKPQGGTFELSPWVKTKFSAMREVSALNWPLEPTKKAIEAPTYYPIINGTNKLVSANFVGAPNEAGNTLSRLLTINRSTFNDYYDSISIPLEMKYLFLAYSSADIGKSINQHFSEAVNESLANTHSTILTELLFSRSTGETSMPELIDNRIASLVHYQCMLQNLALILTKYNQLMLLTDELVKMGFKAEAAITTELLALLKKSSMIAQFKSLAKTMLGKYFDYEWYKNFTKLTEVPTRKSNSIREPLITTTPYYALPNAKLISEGVAWYDSSSFTTGCTITSLFTGGDNYSYLENTDMATYTQALVQLLDQEHVLKFTRQLFNGTLPTKSNYQTPTVTTYFNNIVKLVRAVQTILNKFTAAATDIEVFLDRAQTAGIMNWKKGIGFALQMESGEVNYNAIINDVLTAYLTSPSKVKWNPTIQKWSYSVLWDEFTGIPKYDQFTGGAYLLFSVRSADIGTTDPLDPAIMIPKLFSITSNPEIVNRSGKPISLGFVVKTPAQLMIDPVLSRILPYSDMTSDEYSLRIASANGDASNPGRISTLIYLLTSQFQIGQVQWTSGKKSLSQTFCKESTLSILDAQIESLGVDLINYVRSNAPLAVWTTKDGPAFGMEAKNS